MLTSSHRANLATSGYSVFLIEAGGDSSADFLQQIPQLYVLDLQNKAAVKLKRWLGMRSRQRYLHILGSFT